MGKLIDCKLIGNISGRSTVNKISRAAATGEYISVTGQKKGKHAEHWSVFVTVIFAVFSSPLLCCADYQRCREEPEHLVEMMNIYSTKTGNHGAQMIECVCYI